MPEQILSHITNRDINYFSNSSSNKNCWILILASLLFLGVRFLKVGIILLQNKVSASSSNSPRNSFDISSSVDYYVTMCFFLWQFIINKLQLTKIFTGWQRFSSRTRLCYFFSLFLHSFQSITQVFPLFLQKFN